jgi:heavy metal sensor kinase
MDVRLTLYYTVVLLASLAVACAFLAYRLHSSILKQVDAILLDEVNEIQGFLRHEGEFTDLKKFIHTQLDQRKEIKIDLRVVDLAGTPIAGTNRGREAVFHLSPNTFDKISLGQPLFETISALVPFRQVSFLVPGSGGGQLVQIVTSLERLRNTMRSFSRNTLILIPLSLILCGLGGWLMARRSLSPIQLIVQTTRRISAQNLEERLLTVQAGDEVDELVKTINDMLDRLNRSFMEIRRFSADAAHELRTPLCAMRGEAEVMLSKKRSAAEYEEALERFLGQFDRLNCLTGDLLLLARFEGEAQPLVSEVVELNGLLKDLLEFFIAVAQEKAIRLSGSTEGEVLVKGKKDLLQRVFFNLLDNALKYTPTGGAVSMEVEITSPWVRVDVRDTGEGIPPEDLPHVCDRFYRVDKSRSRQTGGSGLGLSISRRIVELHCGHIHIHSVPTQGTTVTVDLPIHS